MDADHADDLSVLHGDEIDVFGVKFIDKPAIAWIVMLSNLSHEGAVIEAVDLLEFLGGFRAFEEVSAVLVHPRPPPTQLSGLPVPGAYNIWPRSCPHTRFQTSLRLRARRESSAKPKLLQE